MHNDTNDVLERLSEELLAQEELPEEQLQEPEFLFPEEDAREVSPEDAVYEEEVLPEEEAAPEEDPFFTEETMVLPTPQIPAFDDPQMIHEPEEPMIFRNFSNGYGRDLPKEEEKAPTMSRSDKIDIGLMIGASGLCLGIIGILIYWLVAYL